MNINQNQYGRACQNYINGQRAGYYQKCGKKNDSSVIEGQETTEKTEQPNGEEKSYREQILEKMEEMAENIRKGTIQPKFQIGAEAYTIGEWTKLLEKFDAAEESLREEVKAQIEEVEKQAAMEALRREMESGLSDGNKVTTVSVPAVTDTDGDLIMPAAVETVEAAVAPETVESVSEEELSLLTDEITKCSYPSDDPQEKHWYITCYGQSGISCKEAYYDGTKWVNKDLWSLSYTEEGQYERVMAFLQRFPQDANLRFAAHENFWEDFLAGEIDEDDFAAFFETTKDGVPDYTYEKDGSTYIDKEKLKYAKYMNDFGTRFYTGREMELIMRGIVHENSKHLKPIDGPDSGQTSPEGSGKPAESGEDIKTQIVTKPDGSTVLQITTSYGVMELEITQAQKFGLMIDLGKERYGNDGTDRMNSGMSNLQTVPGSGVR
mgnify:CR=1 FL=1